MKTGNKPLINAFGYFCYIAGIIFFLCGVGFTLVLGYQMFTGDEGTLLITLMFPIGPILMALGYAVFKLGFNIHNPIPLEVSERFEDENL